MVVKNFGKVDVILDEYMKKNKISRNSLVRNAEMQYKQVIKYCDNNVQKFDLNILAKICTALDCEITDILKLTKGNSD